RGSLWYRDDGSADPAAQASGGVRTHLGMRRIEIHRNHRMVGFRTHVAELEREILCNTALDRKAPLLNGRSVHGRLHSSNRINRAVLLRPDELRIAGRRHGN